MKSRADQGMRQGGFALISAIAKDFFSQIIQSKRSEPLKYSLIFIPQDRKAILKYTLR